MVKKYNKAVFYGDSITKGTYTALGDSAPVRVAQPCYAELVAKGLKAKTFVNYGVNGISYSAASSVLPELSLIKTVENFDAGDVIFIAAGTNDYGTDVPTGKLYDNSENTFYGAVFGVLKKLKEKAPRADIYVILPIPRINENVKNKAGFVLNDYRKALCETAKLCSVNVIDGSKLNINPANASDKNNYIFDGTHINEAGHKMLAELILSELNK